MAQIVSVAVERVHGVDVTGAERAQPQPFGGEGRLFLRREGHLLQ
jgi:hypothetical protein